MDSITTRKNWDNRHSSGNLLVAECPSTWAEEASEENPENDMSG
jgi:hypothetical protein